MNTKDYLISLFLILFTPLLLGCSATQAELDFPEGTVIKITGRVDNVRGWTEDDLKSLDSTELEFTDQDGANQTYVGVPLANVLAESSIHTDAENLQFVKYDGSSRIIALSDLVACENCLVTFQHEGKKAGLTILLPGIDGQNKLIGIGEIVIK
jgi:hypothetical protein